VSWIGESVADRQLGRFKTRPGSRGLACREGLWRYSRHPNYFFEWLVWIAYSLLAWPAPHGYLALPIPLLMLFFLLRVTGIPYTEAQALRSRGEAYARYQREVSAFIPWFPRRQASMKDPA
jgi:steroid 5-alpha reductase family enzyme